MTSDYLTFKNEIYSQFYDAWKVDAVAIVGYLPATFFGGIEYDFDTSSDKFYAKIKLRVTDEKQKTLCTTVSEVGKRRYEGNGVILVEILCPLSDASYTALGERLATSVQNSFRGKQTSSCVIFRNAKIVENLHDDKFYSFNVVVNFNYETIA